MVAGASALGMLVSCAVFRQNRLGLCVILVFILAVLPLLIGLLGRYLTYITLMEVMHSVEASQREALYRTVMAHSRIPTIFGGILSALLLVIGLLGLRFRRTGA